MLLREIVKKGEKPQGSPTNLNRTNQLVVKFGEITYVLSKELTKLFRTGKINFSDLGNYEVRQMTVTNTTTGLPETMWSLGLVGEMKTVEDFTGFSDAPATSGTITQDEVKKQMAVEFKAITTL